jgi:hypothetical protein
MDEMDEYRQRIERRINRRMKTDRRRLKTDRPRMLDSGVLLNLLLLILGGIAVLFGRD